MRRLFVKLAGPILALGAGHALAAQDATPDPLAFQDFTVQQIGNGGTVEVVERAGRQELALNRASAMLQGVAFADGVIEFDVAFDDLRGFAGLMWHVGEPGDYEYFYMRKHKSGLPDAGQYTPARGGLTAWQIYSDENAIAPFAFTYEGWNRIRFVIADDRADIYFNGSSEPVLHVPDLATGRGRGGIGFRTSGPNGAMRVSNLVIRALLPGEGIVGNPQEVTPPPPGVITNWNVSERFAENRIADALSLPEDIALLGNVATVRAETNGIVDLSRAAAPSDDGDTVLVSTRITANTAKRVRLRFGYSDRVRLFLNGELVFDGAAGFRQRDFFFLGTIGFSDAVVLDLGEGENVLTAAVSETFGGWGFAGAIAEDAGLTISP